MKKLTLSPCTNICKIDKRTGLCIGCKRNESEIFNWINFSEKQKKIILSNIKDRIKAHNKT